MQIRAAQPGDFAAMVAIQDALLATTTFEWTEALHTVAELAARIEASGAVLVAEVDGSVAGWAAYGEFRYSVRWPGYARTVEHTIHVREGQWGAGVGRALMDALLTSARDVGKQVMVGGIDGTNERSIRFHARLGFVEVGRLPGIGGRWDGGSISC